MNKQFDPLRSGESINYWNGLGMIAKHFYTLNN
jgi:hypothetical protein